MDRVSVYAGRFREDIFDRVIIATGELWQPRPLALPGAEHFSGTMMSSREYQEPEKFPTAASRRSLDRVSVPVWLVILSDQLGIVA
ncbi:hypothetical protein AADJ18_00020 [Erwinia amylovora]|uniref:hypothetical protein n=1 Tax=Erwinia amylovora TaxID=552 RepID=UPI0037DDDC29